MADLSESQIRNLIAQVSSEVNAETATREAEVFKVGSLREHLTDFAKFGGGESAWTISYSTSSGAVGRLKDVAGVGGDAAWTISYSTSSVADVVQQRLESGA